MTASPEEFVEALRSSLKETERLSVSVSRQSPRNGFHSPSGHSLIVRRGFGPGSG
jgi:Erythronolide synthase docking domain